MRPTRAPFVRSLSPQNCLDPWDHKEAPPVTLKQLNRNLDLY